MHSSSPVLSWWEGRYVFGVGKVGDYVIADSSYREIARFSSARHRRPDAARHVPTDVNLARAVLRIAATGLGDGAADSPTQPGSPSEVRDALPIGGVRRTPSSTG